MNTGKTWKESLQIGTQWVHVSTATKVKETMRVENEENEGGEGGVTDALLKEHETNNGFDQSRTG